MDKKKELAKNTIIILIGKICTQFISFFLLPLYTAILDSSEYGIVDLVITYVSLFVPLITVQLEQALFRYLVDVRNNEDGKKNIISCTMFCVLIFILICLVGYFIVGLFVNIKFKYYILINVIVCIFSNLFLQAARGLGDNTSYSIGSVIAGASTIVFNVLFLVVFKMGPSGMLLSMILANLLCALFLFIKNKIYKYISFNEIDKETCFKLLKYSIPLVPNGIIWWVINVSDRTIITIFLGTSANGIYAVSNKFSGVLINFYNVFNTSWTESASLHIDDEDRDEFFSSTIKTMFNLFSSVCVGIVACMPFVFPLMINKQYNEAYYYIPILIIGTLFNIIVGLFSVIYVAKKMTKKIAQTSFWSGVINIVINLLLVKYIGLWAAALSTCVAFATMAIYRYFDVQKYVKVRLGMKTIIGTILIFGLTIIMYFSNKFVLYVLNLIIVVLYSIFVNKVFLLETLHTVINKIKK